MSVRAMYDDDGKTRELYTVGPTSSHFAGRNVEDRLGDQGLELLNKLGEEGWQLVSTETEPAGRWQRRIFWLKHRLGA